MFDLRQIFELTPAVILGMLNHHEKEEPMNSITITKLYEQLSSKVGKETAESLITFIEQKVREEAKEHARDLSIRRDLINGPGGIRADEKKSRRRENAVWLLWLALWLQAAIVVAIWLFHFLK
jgi:hypothetical protein